MNEKITWAVIIILGITIIIGGFFALQSFEHAKAVKLQTFAGCLKDKGALFYGAFWCPHCQEQKGLFSTVFESGDKSLPYVECSTPDGNAQLEICKTQEIKTYPTWKFTDGSKIEGKATLAELSQKTSCPLP